MIHSLLGVCLICMGVGARASTPINSYRHTEEKQERAVLEENEPASTPLTFNNEIDIEDYTEKYFYQLNATASQTIPNADVDAYMNSVKCKWDNTNFTTMLVKGQVIDQNLVLYDHYSTPRYGVAIPHVNNMTHETTSLMVFQITPYNYIAESTFTVHMKLQAKFNNMQNPDYGTVSFHCNILNSTLETWQQYVDIQNYAPYGQNFQIYQALTNGTLGTNYERQERNYSFELDNTISTAYYDIEADININSNETNYVVIYIEPILISPSNINDPYYVIQSGNSGDDGNPPTGEWIDIFTGGSCYPNVAYRKLEISGTYIIPPSNYEVVDIPGLMWEILTMPFAFISTAFNLTLFPGTPYQVNISNLVLSVFGVLVFMYIFKIILKR